MMGWRARMYRMRQIRNGRCDGIVGDGICMYKYITAYHYSLLYWELSINLMNVNSLNNC